ncbi:hypothetical protein [Mongoliibacter ruber]|uniref:Uncharacterized protein n=1 Tax=Mongoliibacter ruber TaxID=1750599 RepID=A0A2T0WT81_9BACT|nr:hypothetical protein [Mongoliibacter ruber]PRY89899.1 hypothetical protein CLW00_102375 [Mongoliibacter ruber]
MDFHKIIKFRIGSEDWEIPLGTLLLLLAITLLLMIGGAYMGFKFGERQFPGEENVGMAGSLMIIYRKEMTVGVRHPERSESLSRSIVGDLLLSRNETLRFAQGEDPYKSVIGGIIFLIKTICPR